MSYFKLFASSLPPRFENRERRPRSQGFYALETRLSSAPLTEESIYHSSVKERNFQSQTNVVFSMSLYVNFLLFFSYLLEIQSLPLNEWTSQSTWVRLETRFLLLRYKQIHGNEILALPPNSQSSCHVPSSQITVVLDRQWGV